jgi:hypothetical protein
MKRGGIAMSPGRRTPEGKGIGFGRTQQEASLRAYHTLKIRAKLQKRGVKITSVVPSPSSKGKSAKAKGHFYEK